jgi:hypothetical protein
VLVAEEGMMKTIIFSEHEWAEIAGCISFCLETQRDQESLACLKLRAYRQRIRETLSETGDNAHGNTQINTTK